MRIARIEAFEFHRALDGSAFNPSWRWHERRAPLLRLTADDGTVGIGEGWSDQTQIGAFFAQARTAAEWLLGREIDIKAIHAELSATESAPAWAAPALASAVDIALWDMRARRLGLPLYRALGGSRASVPVYASGGLYGDDKGQDALAAEMGSYAARGYTAVKLKIGGLPLEADLARVAAVRSAVGPACAIIVDAVERLSAAEAPAWVDRLAEYGVAAIQAPLRANDLAGMAALQARGPLPVVAGERLYRPESLAALLERRCVGWLQLCPGLAGGFTGSLAVIAIAQAARVPVTLQCYSTAVMQGACFHLGAGRPGVCSVEFHQFHDNLYAAFPPGMRDVSRGGVHLGDHPGLGFDPANLGPSWCGPGTIRPVFRLPG